MPYDFKYNGKSSKDYGIIITKIEDNESMGMSREVITGERNKYRDRLNHFGTMWSENLSFTLTITKSVCERQVNELFFTSNDIREINAWLTSPRFPKEFQFINDNYFDEQIVYFALITELQAESIRKPYSLSYTVTCDSPFGYTLPITQQISSISTIPNQIVLTNGSDDLEGYVYPTFKIHPKSHSDLTLRNDTDDGGEMIISMLKDDDFYIDCERLMIHDVTGNLISFEDLGIDNVDEIYWPRLCSGQNTLVFQGDADIEITYREPRKVGAF